MCMDREKIGIIINSDVGLLLTLNKAQFLSIHICFFGLWMKIERARVPNKGD